VTHSRQPMMVLVLFLAMKLKFFRQILGGNLFQFISDFINKKLNNVETHCHASLRQYNEVETIRRIVST